MRDRLIEVFKRTFEVEKVNENTSQKNLENWDSLNHINLVIEIENEFEISIEPEEMDEMKDFKTIERIVSEKLKN